MSLTPELISAYNATRRTADTGVLCHFPWTTINFDQSGRATACCYNRTHVLGTYPQDTIESMWYGPKADELRGFIERNDLQHGCQSCLDQIVGRNFVGTLARGADHLAVERQAKTWHEQRAWPKREHASLPKLVEFELHNTCNLECIMCSGRFSSSIRRNREQLPPSRSPYDAAFVSELVPFLPHLKAARFLGGEPFLINLYYDIWERIIVHNPELDVSITTNATVLTRRAMDVLDQLRCRIIVSIDSVVKQTYEQIRVNARYDEVMRNVQYLLDLTRRKQTSMSFAVCPMTVNWHDIPETVAHCNERDIHVYFNTVTWPPDLTLQNLTSSELDGIDRYLSGFELGTATYVQRANRAAYLSLINQVRHWQSMSS
jgi:MoaA/NifB/PqqE/SkfB family radical SAM enzyme